ncbi:MAG TPA: NAD-dependent epimerase/dehydratase family protein [Caulobacteraceae bacterium]|nr:NAD-dependent epimerase/dehydratase family protein [Caulobacteraceae bacterium]
MNNVLVTGGAGFIGSHLSAELLALGYRVRVLDNLDLGRAEWVPSAAEFVQGDIRDLGSCRDAVQGMDGVFHCAAMSRAGPSLGTVELCTQSNIVGTQNMLIAARDAGLRKFVYSGSSTCYGSQPPPHNERETALEFLNFYALTKQVGEQYCFQFAKHFDFPCAVLRYFNVYGPRQPEEGAYALVLGIFLRRWLDGKTLEIHGDGSQRRDFIHVSDVVRANIAAYEASCGPGPYNVGSGTNISVQELADLISADQIHTPRRKGDAEVTLADISRIRSEIGWSPTISFEDGLKDLVATMRAAQ